MQKQHSLDLDDVFADDVTVLADGHCRFIYSVTDSCRKCAEVGQTCSPRHSATGRGVSNACAQDPAVDPETHARYSVDNTLPEPDAYTRYPAAGVDNAQPETFTRTSAANGPELDTYPPYPEVDNAHPDTYAQYLDHHTHTDTYRHYSVDDAYPDLYTPYSADQRDTVTYARSLDGHGYGVKDARYSAEVPLSGADTRYLAENARYSTEDGRYSATDGRYSVANGRYSAEDTANRSAARNARNVRFSENIEYSFCDGQRDGHCGAAAALKARPNRLELVNKTNRLTWPTHAANQVYGEGECGGGGTGVREAGVGGGGGRGKGACGSIKGSLADFMSGAQKQSAVYPLSSS